MFQTSVMYVQFAFEEKTCEIYLDTILYHGMLNSILQHKYSYKLKS